MNYSRINEVSKSYDILNWSDGYFYINKLGHIGVRPNPNYPELCLDLANVIKKRKIKGQSLPTLFCFPQILQHRLRSINYAFKQAKNFFDYKNNYLLVYPFKVNQQKRIIESFIDSGESFGLEVGSKAELLAVMFYNTKIICDIIICNGYKDKEYINLAFIGEKIGYKVYIVVEKISELILILDISEKLKVKPRLGIRINLSFKDLHSNKKFFNKNKQIKFGLTSEQILKLINILHKKKKSNILKLLHFHLGSQLSNIKDIVYSVQDSLRLYVELYKLGFNIKYLDIGGGLGVNYSTSYYSLNDSSVNYDINEYANSVICNIKNVCDKYKVPHPMLITESGRALTAHHSILISNVINIERNEIKTNKIKKPKKYDPEIMKKLWLLWSNIKRSNVIKDILKYFEDCKLCLYHAYSQYRIGALNLIQRIWIDQLYLIICHSIFIFLNSNNSKNKNIIDELQMILADRLYLNFSIFKSIPDSWGINQIFPILPLTGLNKPLKRRAILFDITCDSDGVINYYNDNKRITSTMPISSYDIKNPPDIGCFMVGAYQEILSNMHNLFGNTAIVNLFIHNSGKIEMNELKENDTLSDVLKYAKYDPNTLTDNFLFKLRNSELKNKIKLKFLEKFKRYLYKSNTYLIN